MSEADNASAPGAFKPKKSVALSGVTAGNTALCTVGRTGNDLHYRGYDILDIAGACEFEEIAYLLVHGKLPNLAELAAYLFSRSDAETSRTPSERELAEHFSVSRGQIRESLAILVAKQPGAQDTFDTESLLGAALSGRQEYAAAEPFLVRGYLGISESANAPREKNHDPRTGQRLIDALERLVEQYDAWGKPDEAAKRRKELVEAKGRFNRR